MLWLLGMRVLPCYGFALLKRVCVGGGVLCEKAANIRVESAPRRARVNFPSSPFAPTPIEYAKGRVPPFWGCHGYQIYNTTTRGKKAPEGEEEEEERRLKSVCLSSPLFVATYMEWGRKLG
jgi:hypothetical protein